MKYPRYFNLAQQTYYDKVMDKSCKKWCPKCKDKKSLKRHNRLWLIQCDKCNAMFKVMRSKIPFFRIGGNDPKLMDSRNWKATCSECGGTMDYSNFKYGCRKCGHILEV